MAEAVCPGALEVKFSSLRIGRDRGHPWWRASSELDVEPLRPSRLHFVGGLCVPESCTLEATAAYAVPLVVPWWRAPRPLPWRLNASHVALPGPLALPHRVYATAFKGLSMWTALRPTAGEAFSARDRWDFVVMEHRALVTLSGERLKLLAPRELRALDSIDPRPVYLLKCLMAFTVRTMPKGSLEFIVDSPVRCL